MPVIDRPPARVLVEESQFGGSDRKRHPHGLLGIQGYEPEALETLDRALQRRRCIRLADV